MLQLPEERFLLLKTSELNNSLPILANFFCIKEHKIRIAHHKRSSNQINPLEEMDAEFFKGKIWHHCHKIMSKYFPEKISDYQL